MRIEVFENGKMRVVDVSGSFNASPGENPQVLEQWEEIRAEFENRRVAELQKWRLANEYLRSLLQAKAVGK